MRSYQISASDGVNGDIFGNAVALSRDKTTAVIGAGYHNDPARRGKVYVYRQVSGVWTEVHTMTASDAADDDQFGFSVACSDDGSVIVVGAHNEDGAGTSRGKVYVYSGSSWGTETMLVASDAADNDHFGYSVECSGDGSVVVVGAYLEAGAGTQRGKAYVYSGTTWSTQTMLTASDAADFDQFGFAVACSASGSVIAVGAPVEDGAGTDRGKVYVYSGSSWGTETGLVASDSQDYDYFGTYLACSDDGSFIVVGAHVEDGAGVARGKVYVYSGSSWGTETMLVPNDPTDSDSFGSSVSCSGDASRIAIGAYDYAATDPSYPGSVYIFDRTGPTTWVQTQKILPPLFTVADLWMAGWVGRSLSQDGSLLLAGAPQWDWDGPGTAFLFDLSSITPFYWGEGKRGWQIDPIGGVDGDFFGSAAAISKDYSTVVIGATGANGSRGKVYVYRQRSGVWTLIATLTASDAAANDNFGAVACSSDGSVIVVGASDEDGAGINRGKVYVYSGTSWSTETMLTASDAADNDVFGKAVACSDDGTIVVVGAFLAGGGGAGPGKVYVYSGSSWATETMLTASDGANSDYFGYGVACSASGSVVVVGAYGEDGAGINRGKVYVYSGTTWGTETMLTASDTDDNDQFGGYVACSADGSVVVVGAADEDGAGLNHGKVYVYSGSSWATETMLTASDPDINDYFGGSVSCSADASRIAIASNDNSVSDPYVPGAMYIFDRTGPATWIQVQKIVPPLFTIADLYMWGGSSQFLSGTGRYVLAGAPQWDADGPGTAFLFELSADVPVFGRRSRGVSW